MKNSVSYFNVFTWALILVITYSCTPLILEVLFLKDVSSWGIVLLLEDVIFSGINWIFSIPGSLRVCSNSSTYSTISIERDGGGVTLMSLIEGEFATVVSLSRIDRELPWEPDNLKKWNWL